MHATLVGAQQTRRPIGRLLRLRVFDCLADAPLVLSQQLPGGLVPFCFTVSPHFSLFSRSRLFFCAHDSMSSYPATRHAHSGSLCVAVVSHNSNVGRSCTARPHNNRDVEPRSLQTKKMCQRLPLSLKCAQQWSKKTITAHLRSSLLIFHFCHI